MKNYMTKWFIVLVSVFVACQPACVAGGFFSKENKKTETVEYYEVKKTHASHSIQSNGLFSQAYRGFLLLGAVATTTAVGLPAAEVIGAIPAIATGTGIFGAAGAYFKQNKYASWLQQYSIGTTQFLSGLLCLRAIQEIPSELAPVACGAFAVALMLKAIHNYKKIVCDEK